MYSESDLEAAVTAGVLHPDTAGAFRQFVAAQRNLPPADQEHFRLLTGFNDIFVSLAAIILLVAVGWLGNVLPPHIAGIGPSPFAGFAISAAAWGLAEFFTRQRRMALPSILLLLSFVGGVFGGVLVIGLVAVEPSFGGYYISPAEEAGSRQTAAGIMTVASLAAAAAAWLHWLRFKVPITVAAGAASLVTLVLGVSGMLLADTSGVYDLLLVLSLLLGVGVFIYAMWWDSSDVQRQTRRSDVAFWLHLLAAPLIVHPVFSLLGLTEGEGGAGEAVIVIALYTVLGLAAVAVDRRALLVSALGYVLWALNNLFYLSGAIELSFALTALVIGSALLMLSAFWAQTRRVVLGPLPAHIRARLAPIDRVPAVRV